MHSNSETLLKWNTPKVVWGKWTWSSQGTSQFNTETFSSPHTRMCVEARVTPEMCQCVCEILCLRVCPPLVRAQWMNCLRICSTHKGATRFWSSPVDSPGAINATTSMCLQHFITFSLRKSQGNGTEPVYSNIQQVWGKYLLDCETESI